jgi:polyphosphate kinase
MDNPASAASLEADTSEHSAEESRIRYFNRELSWLAFNRRVLEEACNGAHPLLERLRFLSISGNNLDEFFMVRVAGLKGQQLLGVEEYSADGMTPAQQLVALATEADRLTASQQAVWSDLRGLLGEAGIAVISETDVDADSAAWLDQHFREQIFPVLTPQAIDPAHPFPFIPNKGFSLIFDLRRLSDGEPIRELLMIPADLAALRPAAGRGRPLHRRRGAGPPPDRHALPRL